MDATTLAFLPSKSLHDVRAILGFFGIFHFLTFTCFILFFSEGLVLAVTISRVIRRNYKYGKKGLALLYPNNSPLGTFRHKSSDEDVIEKFIAHEDGHKLLEEFSKVCTYFSLFLNQ